MKIVAVGDSFVHVEVFRQGFADLEHAHEVQYMQLDESKAFRPTTDSERSIREFLGTPSQLADRVGDADILAVHGAPVTDEVLGAGSRLQLVGCARGGPAKPEVEPTSAGRLPL